MTEDIRPGSEDEGAPLPRHTPDAGDAIPVSPATSGLTELLLARWQSLGSRQKLRAKQIGVGTAIGVLGIALYTASGHSHQAVKPATGAAKLDMGAGLRGDSLEEKLRGDLKKVLDGQTLLGDRVSAIEEGKIQIGSKAPPADGSATSNDAGPLPPALPDVPVNYPPTPPDAKGGKSAEDDSLPPPPSGPSAPPAPPVEKLVGGIGDASAPIVPKDGTQAGIGADSKKRIGRSICRLVS